jgi:O-antigen/teichoic acid export membrane protein
MSGIRFKIFHSAISGVGLTFLNIIITFISIPVFVGIMGMERYGIFALVSTISNANVLFNFGFNFSLVKFLAQQGKCKESNFDILVSFILVSFIVSPFLLIIVIFKDLIVTNVLNIPDNYYEDSIVLIVYICLSSIVLLFGQLLKAVTDSLQKMYLGNYAQGFYNLFYWGLVIAAAYIYGSFHAIGVAILTATILWFFILLIMFFKNWGCLSFCGFSTNFSRLIKKHMNYNVNLYLANFIGLFREPLLKVLVSHYLGINYVSILDIALRICRIIRSLFSKIIHPFYPYMATIANVEQLRFLISEIEQKIYLVSLPCSVIFIFCAQSFLNLWIGDKVPGVLFTVQIAVCSMCLFSISMIPIEQYLTGKNHPSKMILLSLGNSLAMTASFLLSVNYFNNYSMGIAIISGQFVSFMVAIYLQKKYLNIYFFNSSVHLIKLIGVFIPLTFIGLIIKLLNSNNAIELVLMCCFLIPVTFLYYRLARLVSIEDFARYYPIMLPFRNFFMKILIKQ